jgi:4-alpha-glucanotransferase
VSDALHDLAVEAGVATGFLDQTGTQRTPPPDTLRALLAALGLPAQDDAAARGTLDRLRRERAARTLPDWLVLPPGPGQRLPLAGDAAPRWQIALEQGGTTDGQGTDLPDLPMGRHRLDLDGAVTWLLAAPPRLPEPPRGWGVTLPLYGLRPPAVGGLGDFGDLGDVVTGLSRVGAGFVGINPVHAGFPAEPGFFSPYAPSHRRRLNALHLACPQDRAGAGQPLVDWPRSIAERLDRFHQDFASFEAAGGDPAFGAWLAEGGDDIRRFAVHQALSQRLGAFWGDWPAEMQDAGSDAVARAAAELGREVRFHAWLQWRAEAQLAEVSAAARAGLRYGLYLDLAVGTHPYGAETWAARSQFATGVSLGAPPDAFSPTGQTWGLAPFNPRALVAEGFAPLAETLRSQLRFSRLLRIDHVLGFERAYCVPTTADLPGSYVAMPRDALLAVVRIEAARAGATIIGEDLGNIPEGLQSAMAAGGLLGCRVAQFERDWSGDRPFRDAAAYDTDVLAAFATHDLPTWRGWRSGADIRARQRIADLPAEATQVVLTERDDDVAAFDRVAGTAGGCHAALTGFLARTPARLLALQIEDLLDLEDQPNLPGTVDEYPNWRRRLPLGAAEIAADPRVAAAASTMALNGRKE